MMYQIIDLKPGARAATLDVEKAYRTTPILPEHKKFCAVSFQNLVWPDHVNPFGLRPASGVHGEIADCVVDILIAIIIAFIAKWIDDNSLFQEPIGSNGVDEQGNTRWIYAGDREFIKFLIAPLQVPWHPEKGQDFGFTFDYLGLLWDIPNRTVQVSIKKIPKFVAKIRAFLDLHGQRVKLAEIQSLAGTLNHIAFVFKHGRSHLTAFASFIAKLDGLPQTRARAVGMFAPSSVWSEAQWWLGELEAPPKIGRGIRSLVRLPRVDHQIWVDASTDWGVGLVVQGLFFAGWRWKEGWRAKERHIGWAEAIAVELAAIWTHRSGVRDAAVVIRGDNQGVRQVFDRGRCRNWEMNLIIRRVNVIAFDANLCFEVEFVPSAQNLADPISRGIAVPGFLPLADPPPLPESLKAFLLE